VSNSDNSTFATRILDWYQIHGRKTLPWQQADIHLQGHAIEVRLTAEDVPAGFLPQTGQVLRWRPPTPQDTGHDVRIDSALREGGQVSPHYDSMVAKIVAHGHDREEARRKLLAAMRQCALLGLPSASPLNGMARVLPGVRVHVYHTTQDELVPWAHALQIESAARQRGCHCWRHDVRGSHNDVQPHVDAVHATLVAEWGAGGAAGTAGYRQP
jgi:biotin carboxylase